MEGMKGELEMSPEGEYEVVWPLGERIVDGRAPAPRPIDLTGKTVAELWDWLAGGDQMFATIRAELKNRFPGIRFIEYQTFGSIQGAGDRERVAALPELLREYGCDAVITGVGG